MLSRLVKIANLLDTLGCYQEADGIDEFLKISADMGYGPNTIEMVSQLNPQEVLKALEWTSGGDRIYVMHLIRWILFQKKFPDRNWNFGSAPRPQGWETGGPKSTDLFQQEPQEKFDESGTMAEFMESEEENVPVDSLMRQSLRSLTDETPEEAATQLSAPRNVA